jgi:amino acid transporter
MTRPRPAKLRRELGPIGLLFAAVGSIFGSGWLFGAFNASVIAGPSALFSWLIAGGMILLIALTYAELGPMFPISGGVVRYPHLVWGSFTSFSVGFVTWISTVAVPAIEVEGALTYASKFAGFTTSSQVNGTIVHVLTPLGYGCAVVLLAIFMALNALGVRLFEQVNNVLVWWKLVVILLVIVVFIFTALSTTTMGSPANFTSHRFAPGGVPGIFIAISTAGITFSFLGFRQGIELAGETKNPSRNIPLAVIGSILITSVIYALLQVAFTIGVPGTVLAKSGGWAHLIFANDFGPLAAISTLTGLTWLAVILYADAIISPTDTGLIYTTVGARVSLAMARDGNAPAPLARISRFGVPFWGLIVSFVAGLVLLLPFPSWQQLVGFITSATVISFGVGPIVVGALRREVPDHPRPFRVPGGDLIPLLAFYSANMIVYWGGWATNSKLFVTVLIGYVFLIVARFTGRRNRRQGLLEFRAGATWILPWFAAMAFISWSCDPLTHPNMFGWVFLINIAVTVGVFYLAVARRLPRDRVEANIRDVEDELANPQPRAPRKVGSRLKGQRGAG